jgi:hypothetical protein
MEAFCYKTGKAIHDSSANAHKALKRLGNRGSTYYCSACNGYHHSSMTNTKRIKGYRDYMFKFRNLFNKNRIVEKENIYDADENEEIENYITAESSKEERLKAFDPITGLYVNVNNELQVDDYMNESQELLPNYNQEHAEPFDQSNTGTIEMNNQDATNIIDRSDRFSNRTKSENHDARSFLNNESKVVQFINQKHYEYGFHTGFNYGSLDAKNTAVNQIIGEFQLLINEAIQQQMEKKAVIKHHLLSIKDLPESVEYAQFKHAIIESDRRIADLENELKLSNTKNGIIKKAISQYETGYSKGYREYLDNSDLLCN